MYCDNTIVASNFKCAKQLLAATLYLALRKSVAVLNAWFSRIKFVSLRRASVWDYQETAINVKILVFFKYRLLNRI